MWAKLPGWFPWNGSWSDLLAWAFLPSLRWVGLERSDQRLPLHIGFTRFHGRIWIFGNPAQGSVKHPEVPAGAWLSPRHSDTAVNSWWSISSGGEELRERFNCRAWMFVLPSGVELMSRKELSGYKWHFPTSPRSRAFAAWTAHFSTSLQQTFQPAEMLLNFTGK